MAVDTPETIIDTINEDHYGSDDDHPVSDSLPINDAEVSVTSPW